MTVNLRVIFHDHITSYEVSGFASAISSYGNLSYGRTDHEICVHIFRKSKTQALKKQLTDWERYGFLRWSEENPG